MRYAGINFRQHDEAGQAKITIVNTTTGQDVIRDYLVDLFINGVNNPADYSAGTYINWMFWWKLDSDTDNYEIYISNGGLNTDNQTYWTAQGITPNGGIQYDYMMITDVMTTGHFQIVANVYHTNFPSDVLQYTLVNNENKSLVQISTFTGDGVTETFKVTGHVYSFEKFSIDNGSTWKYPSDMSITWGSNSPNYDDELFDSESNFTIKFVEAPSIDSQIKVNWLPMVNRCYVVTTGCLSSNGIDWVDYSENIRLIDNAIEFIP